MLLRNVTLELNNMEAEICGIQSALAKPQSQAAQWEEQKYWISDREHDESHLVGLWVVSSNYLHNKFLKVYMQFTGLLGAGNIFPKKFIPESM